MRLIGYSLSKGQPVFEQRLDHRISHILADQHSPHCLLLTQTRQQDQFRLFDTRAPALASPVFGWAETANTSRYLRPSWHPAGNLIACGSSNPASRAAGINFWDIRYLSKTASPLQMVDVQPDKRYWRTEFHPAKDLLVALATDGSLSFIDYTLA
jgi:WD40 repeat protein